jgi:APA family basic amino acid/polyamine antiporter
VAVGLIGAESLGRSDSPLVEAISIVGNPALMYVVSLGGMIATSSVLLTSILGVSRVSFAMARRKDLPAAFSRLHPKYNTPHVSILIAGAVMTLLVLSVDLTGVVAVSTFAQLFYYGSANLAALRLKADARLYPRFLPAAALGSCILLLFFVKPAALAIGVICLAAGAIYHIVREKGNASAEVPSHVEHARKE